MDTSITSQNKMEYENSIEGVWWLLSREDFTYDNEKRIDPTLGPNPYGILVYANGHFAAQFMKRDRSNKKDEPIYKKGQNNTTAIGGYDAYFGTYEVDKKTGQVAHTLVGSLAPENIGIKVERTLNVINNQLQIKLETTTLEEENIMRTLIWKRIK